MSYIITEAEAAEFGWPITDDKAGTWARTPHHGTLKLNVPLCDGCDSELSDGICADCETPAEARHAA